MAASFAPREPECVILVHVKNEKFLHFLIMKTCKNIHCFVGVILVVCLPTLGQVAPVLSIQLSPAISITGTNAGLYAVQATSDPSGSNGWACVGLVQLPATNCLWVDTHAMSNQQFYRTALTSTNLVYILPGTFTMGSPTNEALRGTGEIDEIQHIVTISKGFYMGKCPVTQAEYLTVAGTNPSHFTGNTLLPVESVSWANASNYCALRTAQERAAGLIPTNWVYRLPTESEWEYACRAGTVTAFYLGSALHSQQANFVGTNEYDSVAGSIYNPTGVNLQTTTVVGSYAPNGWGLYDMAGNVAEWCQDWSGSYPTGFVIDPQGPSTGVGKVIRGGSWLNSGVDCRSAARSGIKNGNSSNFVGLRVVLAPIP
jgi:formylglycine-generating enzyme required for sulfatase activity